MSAQPSLWTCPYCPLLCDRFALDEALTLSGSDCTVAQDGLAHARVATGVPLVGGQPASLDEAMAAAARLLRASRQPLLAGMGTDVAGARALHALARACAAQTDALAGHALMQAVRSQQDRGGYTSTLSEMHERADRIVFIGSWPLARAPELLNRLRREDGSLPPLALLGARAEGQTSVAAEADLLASLAELTAHVAGRAVPRATPALRQLADDLLAARYAVLVWEPAQLGPHAALAIERAQHLVGLLNQTTRAGGFVLGAGEGASTTNQVFTWLDALPLRTRRTALGLEHEPLLGAAERVLADGAADLLLWVSQWQPRTPPPAPPRWAGPTIVLGLPALGAGVVTSADVFIPVAIPGIDVAGHLFRSDGVVLLPLHAQRQNALPTLAEVVARLTAELEGQP